MTRSSLDLAQLKKCVTYSKGVATLDLTRRRLKKPPAGIREVPAVMAEKGEKARWKEVHLSYNHLREFGDEDFDALNGFDAVHLAAVGWRTVSPSVARLDGPLVLNLSLNKLSDLPPELYTLTQLKSLRVNWSEIENFSPSIRKLALVDIEVGMTPFIDVVDGIRREGGRPSTKSDEAVWKTVRLLARTGCEIIG